MSLHSSPHDNADPDNEIFDVDYQLKLTTADAAMISTMQVSGGFPDIESLIDMALFHYARHLQIGDVPAEFMSLRRRLNRLGRPYKGKK